MYAQNIFAINTEQWNFRNTFVTCRDILTSFVLIVLTVSILVCFLWTMKLVCEVTKWFNVVFEWRWMWYWIFMDTFLWQTVNCLYYWILCFFFVWSGLELHSIPSVDVVKSDQENRFSFDLLKLPSKRKCKVSFALWEYRCDAMRAIEITRISYDMNLKLVAINLNYTFTNIAYLTMQTFYFESIKSSSWHAEASTMMNTVAMRQKKKNANVISSYKRYNLLFKVNVKLSLFNLAYNNLMNVKNIMAVYNNLFWQKYGPETLCLVV